MPIDLRKYDGRYVVIQDSTREIIGKLIIEEEIKILNYYSPDKEDSGSAFEYIEKYVGKYNSSGIYENVDVKPEITINERNINTIKDITEEIYSQLHFQKELREEGKKWREATVSHHELKISEEISYTDQEIEGLKRDLSLLHIQLKRLDQLKKDIEQIKEVKKQRRLPFIYYP